MVIKEICVVGVMRFISFLKDAEVIRSVRVFRVNSLIEDIGVLWVRVNGVNKVIWLIRTQVTRIMNVIGIIRVIWVIV